jgi:hypothetical protein
VRQLATEYLEFTQRSLERRGYRALKLSDEFVEANLHQLILRARRFTSHRTERDEIDAAQLRLKEAAETLLREFPEACQVAAVTIAAEQPDDPRLLGFAAALANLKL